MMRHEHYILDDSGEPVPVDLMTWGRWWEDSDKRIVLQDHPNIRSRGTRTKGRYGRPSRRRLMVSTVFLGLDHNWGDGPPVLWETMIFGGPFNEYQERYRSRLDALRGHQQALGLVELFVAAPRRLKKALRKFGAGGGYDLRPRETHRLARALARIGVTP